MSQAELRPVELRGLPVSAQLRSKQHHFDLLHELKMLQAHITSDTGEVEAAPELARLIEETIAVHPQARDALWESAAQAESAGESRFDVTLQMPPAAVAVAERALQLYEEADRLCREQQLLEMAAPPEVARYRRWVGEELRRQLVDGAEPRTYPD